MALTQDELDQVYNYVMGKGQSLAGLPDGGKDLSSMYLAPLLKYSPGGAATLVRLAVSLLKGDSAYQVWVNEPGNTGKTLSDFFLSIKGAKGDPFKFADFTDEQLSGLALTWDKLTSEQKEEMKLHFSDLTEADIISLQKPATDAAARVDEKMAQISEDVSQIIEETTEVKNVAVTATENAGKATDAAIAAVGLVGTAIKNAKVATDLATDAAELAEQKAGLANTAAGVAYLATEKANTAAGKADTATTNAEEATIRLDALSDHRDIIKDGYWWQWNETTKEYEKTGNRADGNTLFASFAVNLATAELEVTTPDGYDGPVFSLEEGNLCVIV